MGLRTALWLANGEWSRDAEPLTAARRERPAVDFAAEILANRTKKILKKIENVEALDGRRRHKLRIAVKKLRYASEFFAGLFPGRKQAIQRKRFSKTLKALQESLGTLNDVEIHRRVATAIAHPQKPSEKEAEKALAMGFIAGQEKQQVASWHCQLNGPQGAFLRPARLERGSTIGEQRTFRPEPPRYRHNEHTTGG
jgi:triphosphatase